MKQPTTISKNKKLLASQDWNLLRKEGLNFIEKLSSDLWSDYNVHDPGITILEVLCYAITELGYKTAYDIKDLLVEKNSEPFEDLYQFLTARQILTNHPVTIYDFRKVMIDIEGVKNGWLDIAKSIEPKLWVDCKKSTILFEKDVEFLSDGTPKTMMRPLMLRGLYTVLLELDKDDQLGDLNEFYVKTLINIGDDEFTIIVDLPSWDTFLNDYVFSNNIKSFGITDLIEINRKRFRVKLNIELEDRTYEKPILVFSSKKSTPERLAAIENELARTGKGSIVDTYLKKIKKALEIAENVREILHAHRNLCEDYYQFKNLEIEKVSVCADVEVESGADNEKVLAEIYYRLERFIAPHVNFYTFDELEEKGKATEEIFEGPALKHGFIDEKELKLSEPKKQILVSDLIQIIMDVKGVVAVKKIMLASHDKTHKLNDGVLWCLKIKEGLIPRFDIDRSKITLYKDVIPYIPIKEDVMEYIDEFYALERKSKLSENEIYDIQVPKGEDQSVEKYYSIQHDFPLTYGIGEKGIPGIVTDKRKAQSRQLKAYLLFFDQLLANYLSQLASVKALFSFSDKVDKTYFYKILYDLPEGFSFPSGDIGNSILFNDEQLPLIYYLLKDFTQKIDPSSHPAIDLEDYETFKTEWIDYKKKTGFEDPSHTHFIKNLDTIIEDSQTFQDRRNRFLDHIMARFAEQFSEYVLLMYNLDKKKAPDELIDDKIAFLQEYPVISSERGKAFNYRDEAAVWDTTNVSGLQKRLSRLLGIDDYTRRDLYCDDDDCDSEGFYLIEHILLRPYVYGDKRMEVCVEKDCDDCFGNMDPYSFRITLIIPYWPERFDYMPFRRFFEKTVRKETLAHIHAKICWADEADIKKFQGAYKEWLESISEKEPDQAIISAKAKLVIEIMNDIRSVYPVATLHDCIEDEGENIVLLNNTILGTFKPDNDENN